MLPAVPGNVTARRQTRADRLLLACTAELPSDTSVLALVDVWAMPYVSHPSLLAAMQAHDLMHEYNV